MYFNEQSRIKVRPQIVNVNSEEPIFFPLVLFNLMSRTNETRHIEWHETFTSKCRLNASVCNHKQGWNEDEWGVNAKNW